LVPAGLHTDYRSARALVDQVRTAAPPAFRARLKSQLNEVRVMIARTAQLSLISTDFAHARERLESILQAHHGYIGQLTMNAPTGTGRSLDAALRVPSAELDASMAELKKLGRVESETQSGEEVTQQYVDLEARIANARNTEQRLTTVLQQQTGKMQDVLDVEKEISRVRGEIETMEAERKTLSGRVEFATINIKVTEEYKAQLQAPDSIGTRLGNAAVAGYRHVADGAMGLAEFGLEYGLSIAIWMAVLFWPARWAWRHYRAG
jgi:chromosome segregation ATPase